MRYPWDGVVGRGLCPEILHTRSQRPELRGDVGGQSGYPRAGVTAGGDQSSWLILPRMLNFYKPEMLHSTDKPCRVSVSPSVTHVSGTTSQRWSVCSLPPLSPQAAPFLGTVSIIGFLCITPGPFRGSCVSANTYVCSRVWECVQITHKQQTHCLAFSTNLSHGSAAFCLMAF